MSASLPAAPSMAGVAATPAWLTLPLVTSCGLIAANIYFAGGRAYAHGGWSLTTWAGLGLPMLAPAGFSTKRPQIHPGGDTP